MVLQKKAPIVLALFLLLMVCLGSCGNKKSAIDHVKLNPAKVPTMHGVDVYSLISDSGLTRYRMKTKIWDMYTYKVKEPYWFFPKGLQMEKLDSVYKVSANIVADTAVYYMNRRLWHLRGHVKIKNLEGLRFFTSEMFYDDRNDKVYSGRPVQIITKDRIINGVGFKSNRNMTDYTIYKFKANLPASTQVRPGAGNSSAAAPNKSGPASSSISGPKKNAKGH